MQKIIFKLALLSSLIGTNLECSHRPAQTTLQSAQVGLISVCMTKYVFDLLQNLPINSPFYTQQTEITAAIENLHAICKIAIAEKYLADKKKNPLNPNFFNNLHDQMHLWKEESAVEQIKYITHFESTLNLLKKILQRKEIEKKEYDSVIFLISVLEQELDVIKNKVNLVEASQQ